LDARANWNENEKAIDAVKPLPEGVVDADVFVADFREKEARLKTIREIELPNLLVERAPNKSQQKSSNSRSALWFTSREGGYWPPAGSRDTFLPPAGSTATGNAHSGKRLAIHPICCKRMLPLPDA